MECKTTVKFNTCLFVDTVHNPCHNFFFLLQKPIKYSYEVNVIEVVKLGLTSSRFGFMHSITRQLNTDIMND